MFYILRHPYRIVIIGGSESGKTHALLNLIKYQRIVTDKIHFYVKGIFKAEHELLINRREKEGIKKLKNLQEFIH